MTLAEHALWRVFKTENFKPFHIRRQAPIGPYWADFASHKARLIIELDGGQHGGSQDKRRDAWFTSQGYFTRRYWNHQVLDNPTGIAELIYETLRMRVYEMGARDSENELRVSPPHFGEG